MRRTGVTGWEKLDGRGLGLSKMHTKGRKPKKSSNNSFAPIAKAGRSGAGLFANGVVGGLDVVMLMFKIPLLVINGLIAVLSVVQAYQESRDENYNN